MDTSSLNRHEQKLFMRINNLSNKYGEIYLERIFSFRTVALAYNGFALDIKTCKLTLPDGTIKKLRPIEAKIVEFIIVMRKQGLIPTIADLERHIYVRDILREMVMELRGNFPGRERELTEIETIPMSVYPYMTWLRKRLPYIITERLPKSSKSSLDLSKSKVK